ncbi:DNA translocase FtsK [Lysinibacillus piscis]|uniref:FtsK domain-containing protein n=1 Tax=Lysinibacillus piscis TaxID=2518931 RepID=A0ABQ5NIT0_9BACI|nr:DNA translocase FtsK [Lysinibacillus sp. KH24]GLC88199.1 hypothetical protein LYSBPC_13260 [Lysinibacillus sp. KH24]
MSWFKKQIDKFFNKDDEEFYMDYEESYDEIETPSATTTQKKFRFPLIEDEQAMFTQQQTKEAFNQMEDVYYEPIEDLSLPKHLNHQVVDASIYDVEVSGIRELLANRAKRTGRTTVTRSQTTQEPPRSKASLVFRDAQVEQSVSKEQPIYEEKPVKSSLPTNRKRFVPTDVPSPVYGFAKPRPIEQLLEDKRKQEVEPIEEATNEDSENILQEKTMETLVEKPYPTLPIIEETPMPQEEYVQELPIVQPTTMTVQEQVQQKEQIVKESEIHLKEMVVENVQIENSTIHIGEVTVLQSTETNEEKQGTEQQITSRVPFNVLMLKTDKAKWAMKQQLKETQSVSVEEPIQLSEEPISLQLEEEETLITEEPVVAYSSQEIASTTLEQIELIDGEISDSEVTEEAGLVMTPPPVKSTKPVKVYQKPLEEFLEPPEQKTQDTEWMEQQGDTLIEALSHFQVQAQIESIMQGPAVTQFEITVSQGTKVSKIRNLADDLKLALAAKDIRIQAPIPGKSSIGIEIPNRVSRAVRLSEVTNSESFLQSDSPLEAALGLDLTGKPVTLDLRKMPHGLIAGATGSGKSVCINSILVSLLYKAAPHELKLMLIDPKMVELAPFNHIPHLVSPVITDVKAATAALKWAVEEMERRYQLFAHAGARDITRYNALADKNNEHSLKLPYILIVIDELADLMMMSPADVEEAICRIAQKARACGIHLIVATQRPSVDVITGLIKSNIPTRIAFAVSSQIDSRTILDGQGAERLLGRGDMLYLGNGMSAPVRLQGTFVTDEEIEAIIDHVREQGEPDYIFDQEELLKKTEVSSEQDDLFEDVCRFVYEQGGASTSLIQRKYHIGYNRAARLIDMLESHGFVSEARGSKPRESYITEDDLMTMFE